MSRAIWIFLWGINLANAGGTASFLDLKWPLVNFIILFATIAWKVKRPLSEMFTKNAEDVAALYELAQEKDKEAQIKLEMYRKKIEGVGRECEGILENFRREGAAFVKEHRKQSARQIEKLAVDCEQRIEFEKRQILNEVKKELVDEILSKVKGKVEESQELKTRATRHLLSKVG